MSRLGKMPNWQKWFVALGIISCSLSGSMYLLGHQFTVYPPILGSHHLLATHGVAAIFAILALGSVLPFHLKAGFKSRKKWFSGLCQLSIISVLIITGALLYYGPEEIREQTVYTHWSIGLVFAGFFIVHLLPRRCQ
jgi:hypothetical protein